jgi:hypothetical protein
MARRRWTWLLAAGLGSLLVWGCERSLGIYWLGDTDLEVEFVVTESGSESAIPGAQILVDSYEGHNKQQFELFTDQRGLAHKQCGYTYCCGFRSTLGITNTFSVDVPAWWFQVRADGFEPSEWVDLVALESTRHQRIGPDKAKLAVPVALKRR